MSLQDSSTSLVYRGFSCDGYLNETTSPILFVVQVVDSLLQDEKKFIVSWCLGCRTLAVVTHLIFRKVGGAREVCVYECMYVCLGIRMKGPPEEGRERLGLVQKLVK